MDTDRSFRSITLRQLFRFGTVGGLATLIHASAFAAGIEVLGITPLYANFAAFGLAFVFSFAGHYFWTFPSHKRSGSSLSGAMFRFLITALIGLMLNTAIVFVVTSIQRASYIYAVLLMVSIVPLAQFLLARQWAFRTKGSN